MTRWSRIDWGENAPNTPWFLLESVRNENDTLIPVTLYREYLWSGFKYNSEGEQVAPIQLNVRLYSAQDGICRVHAQIYWSVLLVTDYWTRPERIGVKNESGIFEGYDCSDPTDPGDISARITIRQILNSLNVPDNERQILVVLIAEALDELE